MHLPVQGSRVKWRKVFVGLATALLIAVWAAGIKYPSSLLAEGIFASTPALLMWLGVVVAAALLLLARVDELPGTVFKLFPCAVAVNVLIGWLFRAWELPFYFDSIGTGIAAIVGGPLLGMATGAASGAVMALGAPGDLAFASVGALAGVLFGWAAKRQWCSSVLRILAAGWLIGLTTALASCPPRLWPQPETNAAGLRHLTDFYFLLSRHQGFSTVMQVLTSDTIDKIFCLLLAGVLLRTLPAALQLRLSYGGNVERLGGLLRAPDEAERAREQMRAYQRHTLQTGR